MLVRNGYGAFIAGRVGRWISHQGNKKVVGYLCFPPDFETEAYRVSVYNSRATDAQKKVVVFRTKSTQENYTQITQIRLGGFHIYIDTE